MMTELYIQPFRSKDCFVRPEVDNSAESNSFSSDDPDIPGETQKLVTAPLANPSRSVGFSLPKSCRPAPRSSQSGN